VPSSPSSVDWDWGERRRRAGGVSAGGVTAPPTTSQTVGGSEGEGVFTVGVVADAILLVLFMFGGGYCLGGSSESFALVAWRRLFCGVCDEKKSS